MKLFTENRILASSLLLSLFYFLINLSVASNYGVTWDFTYHFNVGLWHLGLPMQDKTVISGPSPPLSDILPAISYLLFFEKFKLLAWDTAYNLYSIFIGSAGIGILFLFITKLINWQTGFVASITLAFLPRYFGHLHNNMKDIPQAVFFMLSLLLFWLLMQKPGLKYLFLSSFIFAVSFNSKVNAIFILVIALIYLISDIVIYKKSKISKYLWLYFIIAPSTALLLWLPFWANPIGRLLEAQHTYSSSTTNMPVLYFGTLFYSGVNIPWHYPFGVLATTTPLIMILFLVLGFVFLLTEAVKKKKYALFILLWFIIPLTRYLKPHMVVIDDLRHFMEVVFPLATIVAVGICQFLLAAKKLLIKINMASLAVPVTAVIFFLYVFYISLQIKNYHPYQTSYFNEATGGIKGAQGKFDIEFWASSYKPALAFLNQNAPKDAKIIVAMAPDIARLYLRPDLQTNLNQYNLAATDPSVYKKSDYTVILNRQSFFNWFNIPAYTNNNKPLYVLTLQSVPLVSIYKN